MIRFGRRVGMMIRYYRQAAEEQQVALDRELREELARLPSGFNCQKDDTPLVIEPDPIHDARLRCPRCKTCYVLDAPRPPFFPEA